MRRATPQRFAPQLPMVLLIAATSLTVAAPTFAAKPSPLPKSITLSCVEQPSRQVSFDGKGQVNYTEVPAQSTDPITLTAVKTDPGQGYNLESARIDSSEAWLNRAQAVWSRGDQIDADNGRLRIDLVNNQLFVTEAMADGNAHFRRFNCEQILAQPPTTVPETPDQ